MPYIRNNTGRREGLVKNLDPVNTAELNFLVTYLSLQFVDRTGGGKYDDYENVIESLENVVFDLRTMDDDVNSLASYVGNPINTDQFSDNIMYLSQLVVNKGFSNKKVAAAIRCCELEFYRSVVGYYEDEKVQENGPVIFEPTKKIPGDKYGEKY